MARGSKARKVVKTFLLERIVALGIKKTGDTYRIGDSLEVMHKATLTNIIKDLQKHEFDYEAAGDI
eukprot:1105065-Amphidinium_carterae.1